MTDNTSMVLDTVAQEIIREVQIGRLTNAKLDVIGKYAHQSVDSANTMNGQLTANMDAMKRAMETCKTSIVATGGVIDDVNVLKIDAKSYENVMKTNAEQLATTKDLFNKHAQENQSWISELMKAQDTQLEVVNRELAKTVALARETDKKYNELQLNKRLLELVGELASITESQNQFETTVTNVLNDIALSVTLIQQQGDDIVTKTNALISEQSTMAENVKNLYENVQQTAIPLHVAQSMRIDRGMKETEHIWAELTQLETGSKQTDEPSTIEQEPIVEVQPTVKKSFFQRLKDAFKGE